MQSCEMPDGHLIILSFAIITHIFPPPLVCCAGLSTPAPSLCHCQANRNHFNGDFPGKPGLLGRPLDCHSPIIFILSILMGQAKTHHINPDTIPPGCSHASPPSSSLSLSLSLRSVSRTRSRLHECTPCRSIPRASPCRNKVSVQCHWSISTQSPLT